MPAGFSGIEPGEAVLVEFGRSRQALGVVLGPARGEAPGVELKPILDRVRADGPLLPRLTLDFARWISEDYLAPPAVVLRSMLPPGMLERLELVAEWSAVRRAEPSEAVARRRSAGAGLSAVDRSDAARGRPAAGTDLDAGRRAGAASRRLCAHRGRGVDQPRLDADGGDGRAALRAVAAAHGRGTDGGWRRRRCGSARTAAAGAAARLAAAEWRTRRPGRDHGAAAAQWRATGRASGTPRRPATAERHGRSRRPGGRRGISTPRLRHGRGLDPAWPGGRRGRNGRAGHSPGARPDAAARARQARTSPRRRPKRWRRSIAAAEPRPATPLLLDGVTGAGKTAVYVEAIAEPRSTGRPVLVLVPGDRARAAARRPAPGRPRRGDRAPPFRPGRGERADEWRRIRAGAVDVVVGTRTAFAAPLADVGLIVVDEEHDAAYKSDRTPRLQARDAALALARLAGAAVVLGSATPSVESVGRVREGRYRHASCPDRPSGAPPGSRSSICGPSWPTAIAASCRALSRRPWPIAAAGRAGDPRDQPPRDGVRRRVPRLRPRPALPRVRADRSSSTRPA